MRTKIVLLLVLCLGLLGASIVQADGAAVQIFNIKNLDVYSVYENDCIRDTVSVDIVQGSAHVPSDGVNLMSYGYIELERFNTCTNTTEMYLTESIYGIEFSREQFYVSPSLQEGWFNTTLPLYDWNYGTYRSVTFNLLLTAVNDNPTRYNRHSHDPGSVLVVNGFERYIPAYVSGSVVVDDGVAFNLDAQQPMSELLSALVAYIVIPE